MKDGWLGGSGKAPKPEGLLWFQGRFLQNFDTSLPCPVILPTVFGSIQLEWSLSQASVRMDVNLKSQICSFRILVEQGRTALSSDYDLNNDKAWAKICTHIHKIIAE